MKRVIKLRFEIQVDVSKCIGCGQCVSACINEVYELVGGKSVPKRPENCVYCRACIVKCPVNAIKITARDIHAPFARFYEK